ncbi:DUF2568 domain-containing protein [Canibacter sp. lx-72]|uniref:DUF2568 domain-containing protein n=1 Tax=Canibacter zhuwentaonis TaxID=2837491 RepID=UPI001BDBD05C|nr:DUF2568 domain-containing protein [Canibacter zhuwentaonis]MBT1018340.1 DUF2568 domain-containing protein [Canibacter zhuwentaonis]
MQKKNRAIVILALVRSLFDVLTLAAIVAWALTNFSLPLPGVLIAISASLGVALVWALFLSARPVLRADRFARAAVALVFYAGGFAAAALTGVSWVIIAPLFVTVAVIAYFDSWVATTYRLPH